jgi:monoamine oxidase
MAGDLEVDVCVIGAGYAGLTAALRLTQAGLSVAVLEARDRVGGRVWTDDSDGTSLDRGAGWFAPYHDASLRLASEMGVSTYKTWVAGSHLLVDGSKIHRYKGLIPRISPLAVVTIAATQWRVNRMARTVPLEAPWSASRAGTWDARSVKQWLDHTHISSDIGSRLFEMAVRGLFATDLDHVSLLHLLFLAHSHGTIDALFSIENGAQENLVDGGAGSIARRIAHQLGDAVHLGTPARSIVQNEQDVTVTADGVVVRARHAAVTIPPALILDVHFEPLLPADRLALYRAAVAGEETKTLVVYDEPFWRGDGYSGQSADPGSPAEVTIDSSPADGSRGVLAAFTFGPIARQYDALEPSARRETLLATLASRFGPRAACPAAVVETSWWHEDWTRGCSMAHLPPGVLTEHGHLLRTPVGRVHFAGTETASISHGAIDGAIRSGERAASEILDRQ